MRILILSLAATLLFAPTARAALAAIYNLGTLGGTSSGALGINNLGQVTGYSLTPSSSGHAFLYSGIPGSGGAMADLGTLGGTSSTAYGLSNSAQAVGSSTTSGGASHAFLYTGTPGSGGAMADLGTLGGTSSTAYAVNNSG